MKASAWAVGIACGAAVIVTLFLWPADRAADSADATAGGRSGGLGSSGGRPPTLVVTRAVGEASVNDRLKAIGSGAARASVTVVPWGDGVLVDVPVTSGAQVTRGTLVARLDDAEERIARDRAARALEDATRNLTRRESLFASRTSTRVEVDDSNGSSETTPSVSTERLAVPGDYVSPGSCETLPRTPPVGIFRSNGFRL